jgi:2,5-diketo-D-gluconate reductase A
MYQQGLTKSLSVSNFSPAQLDCVLQSSKVAKPVVNQLPYSVAYHPGNAVAENQKRGILVQAWAPLGGSLGGRFSSSMKGTCAQIGKKYNKSFAQVRYDLATLLQQCTPKLLRSRLTIFRFTAWQVALRWIVQTGGSFTTQSTKKEHFVENLDIFDFELTAEEMQTLSALA